MIVWLLAACVPRARFDQLESAYDGAVAARDRANADLDVCRSDAEQAAAESAREAEARALEHAALEAGFASLVTRGLAPPSSDPRTLRWTADPWFEPDTADLRPEGESALRALAAPLAAIGGRFEVIASVPGVPPANAKEYPTAWHLAGDRATAVIVALVAAGFPADRLVGSADPGGEAPTVTIRGWR